MSSHDAATSNAEHDYDYYAQLYNTGPAAYKEWYLAYCQQYSVDAQAYSGQQTYGYALPTLEQPRAAAKAVLNPLEQEEEEKRRLRKLAKAEAASKNTSQGKAKSAHSRSNCSAASAIPATELSGISQNSSPSAHPYTTLVIPAYDPFTPTGMYGASHPSAYSGASSAGTIGGSSATSDENAPRKRKVMRGAGGEIWEDKTLEEWSESDLGPEVTDEMLLSTFSPRFPSFVKARVVLDKKSTKSRGYGFVSFREATDYTKAFQEFNNKYIGSRPVKLRKSTWKDRSLDVRSSKKQKKNGS